MSNAGVDWPKPWRLNPNVHSCRKDHEGFSAVPSLPAWSLLAQLRVGEGAPSLFPVPAARVQGLPHPQLRK
jgi:hypothetical protein